MPTPQYSAMPPIDVTRPISPQNGQLEQGNIDLYNRPNIQNPDGSHSTVRSIGITDDVGNNIVIPTVMSDGRGVVSNKEAISNYLKTGQHLGKFQTQEQADRFASQLHLDYANGLYNKVPERIHRMDDNTAPVLPTSPATMGGPPPAIATPPPPQVQQAPPPDPQQQAQQASIAHDSLFGRAAKMLLGGNDTQYSVDANGNTVQSQGSQAPGQFFKNVLSAAILGGAAGANGNPAQGFAGGLVRGGAAGIQQGQQQDQQKRLQAQQQFKNQQEAAQNQREEQAATSTEQLRKAQIANANAETARTQQLTLGADLDLHQKVADAGKANVADYNDAGLKPIFKDIPEADMQQTISNRPGASTFDWEPTGVKVGVDPKTGQPTHEYTYSAYDPKGQVPVSQGTIDKWKKDGMDKVYPELFGVVKAGKPLDASQYIELKRKDTQLYNDNLVRTKNDLSTEKAQADLRHVNAQTAASLATAVHERTQTGMLQLEKTKQQAMSNAFDELNKVGGDFDKLSPKSKLIIGESQATLLPSMETEYKTAVADGDQTLAQNVLGQITSIRSLSTQAIHHGSAPAGGTPTGPMVSVTLANGQTGTVPQGGIDAFLKKYPGSKVASSGPKEADSSEGSPTLSSITADQIPNASAR